MLYNEVMDDKYINQRNQRQDSLYDQLKDLIGVANSIGCYDAADFLQTQVQKIENKNKPKLALCHKCDDKIIQPDLIDPKCTHICGCKNLSKQEWGAGLLNGLQSRCPFIQ